MIDMRGPYRIGAVFCGLSALLLLLMPVLSGFAASAVPPALVGLVVLAVAYGLLRGWRWLAYVAFVGLFGLGIVGLSYIWAPHPVPVWIVMGSIITNWLASAALFLALWNPAPTPPDDRI